MKNEGSRISTKTGSNIAFCLFICPIDLAFIGLFRFTAFAGAFKYPVEIAFLISPT